MRPARKKIGKSFASLKVDARKLNCEKEKGKASLTINKERLEPDAAVRRFRGPPLRLYVQLVPGLEALVAKAAGDVQDIRTSPAQQIAASRNACQQIADGAVGFFHAVYYFAARGHSWAIRILTEFALSATSALEGIVEQRSPTEAIDPCSPFGAVLSIARENRRFPVLLRRHAKAHNKKKLKLPEIVQLGAALGERINKRRPPDPARPVNRVIDLYLAHIRANPQLQHGLPLLRRSKPVCRKWALCILDLFEQNDGPVIDRPEFASILKYGSKTAKGKRGAIRDAIQNALYRRQIEV